MPMSMLRNPAHNHHLVEQATTALTYLGIFTAFAAVSVIACAVWLVIW
jgi:hypothetical protein